MGLRSANARFALRYADRDGPGSPSLTLAKSGMEERHATFSFIGEFRAGRAVVSQARCLSGPGTRAAGGPRSQAKPREERGERSRGETTAASVTLFPKFPE